MATNESTINAWTSVSSLSPKRVANSQHVLPDSPDYVEKYNINSDDLQPTSNLHSSSSINHLSRSQNLVVVGSHEKPITLGRGGACTIKIGRRNRQISRIHVSIAFNSQKEQFELTVLGLNGAYVDDVLYEQHAVAPLEDDSFVDVVGDQFRFKMPPPASSINFADKLKQQQQEHNDVKQVVVQKNVDFFREMSPEAEQQQEDNEEEISVNGTPVKSEAAGILSNEQVKDNTTASLVKLNTQKDEGSFPSDLQPDEALSPVEKELSPEINVEQDTIEPVKEEIVQQPKAEKPVQKKLTQKEIRKALKREEKKKTLILQEKKKQHLQEDGNDYAQVIIDALVFSRTSSMPISDICSRILKANPTYAKQPREIWIERISTVLKEKPFFGEIQRKGKTADGSPTENLYYYNSELDPVEWRRATYTQVGRSARKCTLKDKQYFWKIPPKLGRHRSSYIPPSASELKKQKAAVDKEHQDENADPRKTNY
ncbi:hypothetical protein [Parasitella parasitica]|uniref:FHA domain-containing protein n=1 Tax=Parasitella parasitica TaxID=35722 RepID=A0A0B7MZZ3_9FUNG|nr:hypothetical protein [Parasitella parasitica]